MNENSTAETGSADEPLDLLCVGIGPFGLGLACLAEPLSDVRAAFLDRRPGFDWHPGLLFDDATLQVPFLADLVTMADPTSEHSFLNWLKETGQLYSFYVRESFYPLRRDYNAYCRWAASRVPGLHWGQEVLEARRPSGSGPWQVRSRDDDGLEQLWWTRHLVIGAGTVPTLPKALDPVGDAVLHAGDYLTHQDRLHGQDHVTVLGSGQSAAEVVVDLLEDPRGPAVDWITRSPRFYPMEYSELSLELTSPEYLDHFRALPQEQRDAINRAQPQLHRGISAETITRIYEALHVRRAAGGRAPVRLLGATELVAAAPHDDRTLLTWRSVETGRSRETVTDAVVAGTGYAPAPLPWLEPVRDQLSLDGAGRLSPDRWHRASPDGTLHVLNHTEHTHALTAPDLGMGALRNAIVLGHVAGRQPYRTERRTMFQSFGRLPQQHWGPRTAEAQPFCAGIDGRRFMLRPVDPQRDGAALHEWLSRPRASAWDLVGASPERIREVFEAIERADDTDAWLVEEIVASDPEHPVRRGFVETYDPARSPLAEHWCVRDGDVGLHFFMAPAQDPVSGTSSAVMSAALRLLFSDPSVQRVVVEPDESNRAIRALNRAAGFRELGPIELPEKTACLSVRERTAADDVHETTVGNAASARPSTDPPERASRERGGSPMTETALTGPETAGSAGPTPAPALDAEGAEQLQRLTLAKLLAEFTHERILAPRPEAEGWVVDDHTGTPRWRFRASRHPLEHWRVDPSSIQRLDDEGRPNSAPRDLDAQQAILDLREVLGLTDRVLPLYLEDLSATQLTSARRQARPAPSSRELAESPLELVEQHLHEGHPGFVASSGRIGFGAAQQERWAPEALEPTPLVWIAARSSRCVVSLGREIDEQEHLQLHLLAPERERFRAVVAAAGEDPQDYTPIPLHPWQWEHRILPGMLPDVLRRDLILVGSSEHRWRAQQSVRTFLDMDDPARDYAKTALGVHSMGFLRGLSPAYMEAMPAISDWLDDIVSADPVLRECGVEVLRERSAVGWVGDAQHRSGVRSDHTKQLAALWRESPVARLAPGQQAASLAGVLHADRDGVPLVRAWIERSGTDPDTWSRALLRVYLLPVAHLLLSRSIALMPHGENVILRLQDGLPVGAFWKDLGEEIAVMDDQPLPPKIERIRTLIEPESQELSVHTDVLDGVLRHLGALLHDDGLLDEQRFWGLAAEVLDEHRAGHPELWRGHDLFREDFAHSCLNRLQLRDPQSMVSLADPLGSQILVGRIRNPLAQFRDVGPTSDEIGSPAGVEVECRDEAASRP